ncbi:MAG: hypothetical protein AAB223_02570, partial [Pseudomonadota bacterium]
MPSFSSWLFLALVVAALLDAFGVGYAGAAAVAFLALFIVLEIRLVAWPQLAIASVLIVAGLAAATSQPGASAIPAVVATLAKGLGAALPFLVLFAAVAWLTVPALESPSLRAARDTVASQPPGWRFATLALAAHLLGSVFNLVAVSLLAILIGRQDRPEVRRRLARALLQGFATATAWSPLFVGTAVILAVLPEVRWISIAPYGVGLAVLLLVLAWSADRLSDPARAPPGAEAPKPKDPPALLAPGLSYWRPAPPGAAAVPLPPDAALRLAGLVTALLAGVIGLVELTGFSIPIVLGLIGPPFALLWRAAHRPQAAIESVADLARKIVRGLADLRTETLMFTAANTFSAGIAQAVPASKAGEAIGLLGLGPDGLIFAFALGLIGASALGLHPVIAVVLIGQVVPPETFGLPLPLLALLLMALWGMGTNVSPFSATNIIMSRAVGVNHWLIAWRWNLPFSLAGAGLVAAVVVGLRR